MTMTTKSPLLKALSAHHVRASVVDMDHYRKLGRVKTDYIISVQSNEMAQVLEAFQSFKLCKTYHSFRALASQLKKIAEKGANHQVRGPGSIPNDLGSAVMFSDSLCQLVNSESYEHFGKVNYTYVQSMANHRRQIMNDTLDLILQHYPTQVEGSTTLRDIARAIETFFLTDHCEEDDTSSQATAQSSQSASHKAHRRHHSLGSPIINGVQNMLTPSHHCNEEDNANANAEETPRPSNPPKRTHKKHHSLGIDITQVCTSSHGENGVSTKKKQRQHRRAAASSPVVPMTRQPRRSLLVRAADDEQLHQASISLLIENDHYQSKQSNDTAVCNMTEKHTPVSLSRTNSTVMDDIIENDKPYVWRSIVVGAALALLWAVRHKTVTINLDFAILIVFAFFCLGLNVQRRSPRSNVDTTAPVVVPRKKPVAHQEVAHENPELISSRLVRKSILARTKSELAMMAAAAEVAVKDEDEKVGGFGSPMPMLPNGSENNHTDCVSIPKYSDFRIRGPNYLVDHIKIPSGPYLFPVRGVDLFLTNSCPGNVGSISGMMGGKAREFPTFIINFVLPWGIFIFYSEIPDKFLPFIRSKYSPSFDSAILASIDDMTPGERTFCRWVIGDDKHKNRTLKIVPVVRKGPWIVKSVVGGKPAIMGKLPIDYIYSPQNGEKAEYLEADLQVVAVAAARSIASVCVRATKGLTIDLGFVIEGQREDELPEQMLMGVRLHSIDPLNAPSFPPMKNMYIEQAPSLDDEDVDDNRVGFCHSWQ